jgi:regulator of protease activity HflC (stomatin/prohibitin superfamily)
VLIPFVDRVRQMIDLREQVVSFPPQPVITADNLTVNIDTVIYFQVTDPRAATYEIANYIQAVEQLTVTTLRNVVGAMNLEQTLTSRDEINTKLRGELDDATGKWGIRVARVELKAIDPPPSIQDAMEKQMRADRDKAGDHPAVEGARESSIKTAEGQKAAQILAAEGAKQSAILAPRPSGSPGSCGPRVSGPPATWPRRGRRRRSRPCSRRSTRPTPTRSCSPTNTCRPSRRSRRATRTRSGSCRASSPRRWRGWPG